MISQGEKVLLVFCDACVDKEDYSLIHMGILNVVAVVQQDFIKPEYVHSYYQKDRIGRTVNENPFYELFSIAEGLENLERIEEKVENVIVFNDCCGTIDLLNRLGKGGNAVSFKHKSLYLECLGKGYNPSVKFRWLKRNDKGIALADYIGRSNMKESNSKFETMVLALLSEKYRCKDLGVFY